MKTKCNFMSDIANFFNIYCDNNGKCAGGIFKTSGNNSFFRFSGRGIERWNNDSSKWEEDNSFLMDIVLGRKDVIKCYDVFSKKEQEFLRPFMKQMPVDWWLQLRTCIAEFFVEEGYMILNKGEEKIQIEIPENTFLKFSDYPGTFQPLELRGEKVTLGGKKRDKMEDEYNSLSEKYHNYYSDC